MHTFIFDFDYTLYDEKEHGAYLCMIYTDALRDMGIIENPRAYIQTYLDRHQPQSPEPYARILMEIHQKYDVRLEQKHIAYALDKIRTLATPKMKSIIADLQGQGHKVMVIGGAALGTHLIPQITEAYGIAKADTYSGYFNGLANHEVEKALQGPFRYINAANPEEDTPPSEKKSELINHLKAKGKLQGKIIHIGDGYNDLEVWERQAADLFIGFGVNRVVPKVKAHAPLFVESVDAFQEAIARITSSDLSFWHKASSIPHINGCT